MNQTVSYPEQLKSLESLQKLDLKIDALKKNQSQFPSSLKTLEAEVIQAKKALSEKELEATETEKAISQAQAALDLNQERLKRASEKLDSVKNSQEFQAASKELEQLKKLNASLEEQIKKSKDELQVIQEQALNLESQHVQVSEKKEALSSQFAGEAIQLGADIQSLNSERTQFVNQVDPRMLNQYNRVRSARGGIGIVSASGGRCQGCNMLVPPQLVNELQKGIAAHACPSCHRFLFVSSPTVDSTKND